MASLLIRLADAAQAEALAALHARAFARPWTATDLEGLMAAEGGMALATGDPPHGFVLLRAVAGEGEILALAVDPPARRRGLGRALVEAAMTATRAAGATALWLEVAEDNLAARALYAACGFAEAGRRRGYYPCRAGAVDALVLRRPLNSP